MFLHGKALATSETRNSKAIVEPAAAYRLLEPHQASGWREGLAGSTKLRMTLAIEQ